jgi:hypothetical protein
MTRKEILETVITRLKAISEFIENEKEHPTVKFDMAIGFSRVEPCLTACCIAGTAVFLAEKRGERQLPQIVDTEDIPQIPWSNLKYEAVKELYLRRVVDRWLFSLHEVEELASFNLRGVLEKIGEEFSNFFLDVNHPNANEEGKKRLRQLILLLEGLDEETIFTYLLTDEN